jgi:7-cyano-7-deazaguanine reductase
MMSEAPLGKATEYPDKYDQALLFGIPRKEGRSTLGLSDELPFGGYDYWTAWEISWLDSTGVPRIASAEIRIPVDSPQLIESKSLKLYLGSFAMTRFDTTEQLVATLTEDLGMCIGADVQVSLHASGQDIAIRKFAGTSVDAAETGCDTYDVDASLLTAGTDHVTESLYSHLLRSLCPVTGQPDLGSVLIRYSGPQIDPAGLLRYIVSYRQHNDFHEACVERMFLDILRRCEPSKLTVYARYQRRGGIDINPFRSNFESAPAPARLPRQ